MAARRTPGVTARLLAPAVGRSSGAPASDRLPTTGGRLFRGSLPHDCAPSRAEQRTGDGEPTDGSDLIHDLAGGLASAVGALQRAERYCRRYDDRWTHTPGARRSHRLLP